MSEWQMPVLLLTVLVLLGFKMWRGAVAVKAEGREVRPKLPRGALFAESGASGSSEGSFKTRIGGAKRILLVSVTRQDFVIECAFPFNLLMHGNPYDLVHRIPTNSVTSVRREGRNVYVTFDDNERRSHTLRLIVKKPDLLVGALKSLSIRAATHRA